jgi:hypothetical protein
MLSRVDLEVSARMMAPAAIPFLRSTLAAQHLYDPLWGERARAVLACFDAPDSRLHPATVAGLSATAPGLLSGDRSIAEALDDPSFSVFATSASIPPQPQEESP